MARDTADWANRFREMIYHSWLRIIGAFLRSWRILGRQIFYILIKVDYDPKSERFFQRFSMMNFDVNFIIIMFILVLFMGLGFFVLLL